jgi:hypothetical protein
LIPKNRRAVLKDLPRHFAGTVCSSPDVRIWRPAAAASGSLKVPVMRTVAIDPGITSLPVAEGGATGGAGIEPGLKAAFNEVGTGVRFPEFQISLGNCSMAVRTLGWRGVFIVISELQRMAMLGASDGTIATVAARQALVGALGHVTHSARGKKEAMSSVLPRISRLSNCL